MPIRPKASKVRKQSVPRASSGDGNARGGKVHGNPDKPRTRKKRKGGKWTDEQRAAARERYHARKNGLPKPFPASDDNGVPASIPKAAAGPAEPTRYAPGFVDGEYQDAGVRGRVFILGLPNSGKSFLLCARIRTGRRVIVFDPVDAKTLKTLVAQDGFVQVHEPGQLRDLIAANFDGDWRILYTPRGGDGLEHFEAVNKIVRFAGHCVYAIDEVDKFQEPGYAPPEFYELLNYGRHVEVAMIGTARRSAQVSKEYTYGLSEICAFRTTEPGDLDYLEKKAAGTRNVIPTLGQYEYLRWMDDGRMTQGKGWK
jgi:hypothetical protein